MDSVKLLFKFRCILLDIILAVFLSVATNNFWQVIWKDTICKSVASVFDNKDCTDTGWLRGTAVEHQS